jgi:hypothetical protein
LHASHVVSHLKMRLKSVDENLKAEKSSTC